MSDTFADWACGHHDCSVYRLSLSLQGSPAHDLGINTWAVFLGGDLYRNYTISCPVLRACVLLQNNASNPTQIYAGVNYTNLAFPGPAAYPFYSASQSNTCNVYIPNDATLSRYTPKQYHKKVSTKSILL